jgi:hypothetical protein
VWGGYRYDEATGVAELTAEGAAYRPPPVTSSEPPTVPPSAPPTTHGPAVTTEPPTDTTETTVPATTVPATTVPPATELDGAATISGTYDGSEEWRIVSDECPDMEHWFDADFRLSTGDIWQFHSDYCGIHEGGIWSGEGTFTFTLPDSSTITGHFVSRAPLPTSGVPYSITITGGTGLGTGASGYCDLTIEIEPVDFGTQLQSGTFDCRIAGM